jgi:hypothetical protein
LKSNHPQEDKPIKAIFFNASLASVFGKDEGGSNTISSPVREGY